MAKSKKWGSGGMVFSTNQEYQNQIESGYQEEVPTLPPSQQHLWVQRDTKRRKGKVVTLVTGFEGSEEALKELSKRLKSSCSVGGSAKEDEIIVQGDLVERVLQLLNEWGYTKARKR